MTDSKVNVVNVDEVPFPDGKIGREMEGATFTLVCTGLHTSRETALAYAFCRRMDGRTKVHACTSLSRWLYSF
jgi:hypothetical protein